MREFLLRASEFAILLIDTLALAVILFGTIEAFVHATLLTRKPSASARREVWSRYAHWLIAGLTFQLGADIIETATAPSWADIGKLGAIAAIRTFLNFFLEHDMTETKEEQKAAATVAGERQTSKS